MKIFSLNLRRISASIIIFTALNLSISNKSYAGIFCIDDEVNWTGGHSIEITYPNASGNIYATIYEHTEDGRDLIAHTLVENHGHDKKMNLFGRGFELEMNMATFNFFSKKNSAKIQFKSKKGLVSGEYVCSFSK